MADRRTSSPKLERVDVCVDCGGGPSLGGGIFWADGFLPCPDCDGSGWKNGRPADMSIADALDACGTCRGEGRLKAPAPPSRPPLTHVAIRYGERVWSLPAPYRHHHIFSVMRYLGEEVPGDGEQGFLDETGRFIRRSAAKLVAQVNGQIKNGKTIANVLTSEDLW